MGPTNPATFPRETAGDAREGGRAFPLDLPLRCVFVATQVATVLLTWRVREPRSHPPMLPLLDLPAVHAAAAE